MRPLGIRLDNLSQRLLLAQALDALTFLWFYTLIGAGMHEERNPLVLVIMTLGGLQAVAVVKVGAALWVSYSRSKPQTRIGRWSRPVTRSWFRRLEIVAISVATASGIVGAAFNTAAIIHASTGFAIRV